MNEKTVESEIVYQGKILTLRRDKVLLDNGNFTMREVVEHPGATCVFPIENGKVTIVEQFRKPVEKSLWEIPAGKLEPGEAPEASARRELIEEAGLEPGVLHFLGKFFTSPGFSGEVMYAYLATNLTSTSVNPDEDEILNIRQVTLNEFEMMLQSGEIDDAKTMLTYYMAKAAFPEVFI